MMTKTPVDSWTYQPDRRIIPQRPTSVTIIHQQAPQTHADLGEAFVAHKAGTNGSHVVYILDSSSSMSTVRKSTLSALNESLDSQRQDKATSVSLYVFNGDHVNCRFARRPIDQVAPLTEADYNPSGMTNLLDAVGGVIAEVNSSLSNRLLLDRESVIFVILTDGEENSSRTFHGAAVKKIVLKCQEANWGFQFLGANIDAFTVGATLGFDKRSTMQFDTAHMGDTMSAATRAMNSMKAAYACGMNTNLAYAAAEFTDDERTASLVGSKK